MLLEWRFRKTKYFLLLSRSLSPDSDDLEDDSEEVDTRWQDGSDEATEDYDCDDTTGREDEATDDVRTTRNNFLIQHFFQSI